MAIEPSRQFSSNRLEEKLDNALKIAKISQLNAAASKTRQEAVNLTLDRYGESGKI